MCNVTQESNYDPEELDMSDLINIEKVRQDSRLNKSGFNKRSRPAMDSGEARHQARDREGEGDNGMQVDEEEGEDKDERYNADELDHHDDHGEVDTIVHLIQNHYSGGNNSLLEQIENVFSLIVGISQELDVSGGQEYAAPASMAPRLPFVTASTSAPCNSITTTLANPRRLLFLCLSLSILTIISCMIATASTIEFASWFSRNRSRDRDKSGQLGYQ